ncbi:MAG TPA: hypothetical protein VF023_05595 [Bryobacteraceae bacterium]|jgi:hypothetical protein
MMPYQDQDEQDKHEPEPPTNGKTVISYRGAMVAYAVLAVVCLFTLHGDALYIALLIIGALAIKTWLVEVKKRIE